MEPVAPVLPLPASTAADGLRAAPTARRSVDSAAVPTDGFPAIDTHPAGSAIETAFALFGQQRDDDALSFARAALAAEPGRADAWTLLGSLHQRAGRLDDAECAYREANRLQPDYADAWTNLGNLLRDREDKRGALLAFQQAMRIGSGLAEPAYNLGVALEHFGDWGGALQAFEATVAWDPLHVQGHWNNALALLRHGHYEAGFREYEWRFRRGRPGPRQCPEPAWDGTPLAGRTLLVWAEQGFGDALQFLRFVPEVVRRGGRVVLEVPDGLRGLAARIPGVAAVSARGAPPPAFDTHVALMSLPFVLGPVAGAPATPGPYLHPPAQRAAQWAERLRARGWTRERELAVGFAWAGNPVLGNDRHRSPGLPALSALLDAPGVRWFALQKGAGRADYAHVALPGHFVDLDAEIDDFDDTAAIMANLDLVVTCDTAVAHLAGALGRPTFVTLPFVPDWRYGLAPHSTDWYPSLRLFRQPACGDWGSVRDAVAAALVERVESTLPRRPSQFAR